MAFSIYKPGQGYWTRMLSGVGGGMFILAGAGWFWRRLEQVGGQYSIYVQASVATAIIVGFGLLLLYLLNKPRIVDFMIATEAEMRKVNWPSRREIIGSTWIVICGTLLMALLLLLVDIFFIWTFTEIGVLRGGV